ncbi:MAG: dTMP kinase [Gammaproteobacteria bacterium]
MQHSGKLITIEGIEGVGKSTQIAAVANYLRKQQISHITTREPGGTPLAEDIRNLILQPRAEPVAVNTELLLLFASRAQHLAQIILPALARGDWVICDRFIDATYAYQGGGRKVPMPRIQELAAWTLGNFKPDLTLLLDAPVELALARAKARSNASDRFEDEKTEFFTAVRAMYLECAKAEPKRIQVIAAEHALETVTQSIIQVLDTFLENRDKV